MIKSIIIFCVIVGGIYFFLKKFTIYRCPTCRSRHVVRLKEESDLKGVSVYLCQECGEKAEKK